MARDTEPVSEDEHRQAEERLAELREQVREDLAHDLGGAPEEYNSDHADEPVSERGRDAGDPARS
jgi:hypothetical protein